VKVQSHPHIRFLPTHPHSISAANIRILPVATSADPHIRFLPIVGDRLILGEAADLFSSAVIGQT